MKAKLRKLCDAVKEDDVEKAESILKSGVGDISGKAGIRVETPLYLVKSGEMAQLLIDYGADPKANCEYDTPLHGAAYTHLTDVCRVLIKEGADLNAKNGDGETPLMYAIQQGVACLETVEVLIASGADVNCADRYGNTALHIIANRPTAVCEALLKAGANANAQNRYGRTPLHECTESDDFECAKILIKYGAKAHIQDERKRLPIEYLRADYEHHDEFKTFLEDTFNKRHINVKPAINPGKSSS